MHNMQITHEFVGTRILSPPSSEYKFACSIAYWYSYKRMVALDGAHGSTYLVAQLYGGGRFCHRRHLAENSFPVLVDTTWRLRRLPKVLHICKCDIWFLNSRDSAALFSLAAVAILHSAALNNTVLIAMIVPIGSIGWCGPIVVCVSARRSHCGSPVGRSWI